MKMRGFIDEPSYTDLHWVCSLLLNTMFGLHLTVCLFSCGIHYSSVTDLKAMFSMVDQSQL